jgi:hypothetical protein
VTDGLDVVAVGVEDERAVVTGVIDGPLTGRPVVVKARRERDAVELVHRRIVGHGEREMEMLRRRATVVDERRGPVLGRDVEPFGAFSAMRMRTIDAIVS